MSINCLLVIRQAMETLVHFSINMLLWVFCTFGVDDPELIATAV